MSCIFLLAPIDDANLEEIQEIAEPESTKPLASIVVLMPWTWALKVGRMLFSP